MVCSFYSVRSLSGSRSVSGPFWRVLLRWFCSGGIFTFFVKHILKRRVLRLARSQANFGDGIEEIARNRAVLA